MRLIIFLMTVAAVHVSATGLAQRISLAVKNAPLESVILDIRFQSNYDFLVDANLIHKAKPVTLNLKDATIQQALTACFAGQQLTYTIENNIVVIKGKSPVLTNASLVNLADTISYSGRIVDETGSPMPGVSVAVQGTNRGAVSDISGNYAVRAGIGTILRFSFLGYDPQEIRTTTNKTINVRLSVTNNKLGEVVVTALGIRKDERKIGYAVSTVKGDVLDKARESNVILSLEGRVAGLSIQGTSAGPGSSARVLLRGAVSQTASSPLYVINGVPMDNTQRGAAQEYGGSDNGDGIGNINPDDIESMTVLKGSAASALYGARAANGVILITTKTGSKSSAVTVEYNTNLSYDQPINNTHFQYDYGMGRLGVRPGDQAAATNDGTRSWGEKLDGAPTIAYNGKMYPYVAFKDNIQTFYRTAPAYTNTVSASGGTDKGVFRVSVSDMDYQGILPNSGVNRKTFNLSTSYEITPKLNVTFNGNYIDEESKNRPFVSDFTKNVDYSLEEMASSLDVRILAPGYNPVTGNELAWSSNIYATNPYFVISKVINNTGRKRFISSTVAKYNFTKWMFLQGRLGYDASNDNIFSVDPTGVIYTTNSKGSLNNLNKSTISELNTDFLFSLNHKIVKDISLDFSAGANYRKRINDAVGISGGQFIIPYLYTPTNLLTSTYSYSYAALQTESAYYTADFNYKNYLTVGTTGRYDVYSTLPSSNRGIFVPAVSASFLFSELTHATGLNYGKLRASYAQTSGEPADAYTTFTSYGLSTPINGVANGTFSMALPNQNLKPYTVNELEIGTEIKWFQNRLGLDFAYFHRVTRNEISNASLSITTGYTSQYVNLGKTQNDGVELMLSGTPVKTKNFTWNSSFNITHINNKVIDIDGSSQFKLAGGYRPFNAYTAFYVGKPELQIMAYDYKRDASGNKIIGADGIPLRGDLIPMGNTLPTYYGGFNNEFNYGNFNLSFLIDYRFGNKVLSSTEYYSYQYGNNLATLVGREGGVVAEGVTAGGSPNTVNSAAYNYYPGLSQNVSAINVIDGRFIKFRQATLGYTFNQSFLNKTPFRAISINLVGRNLFTIMKKAKNIDPESGYNSTLNYSGIESPSLPATRTYGINANFKFK